MLRRHGGRDYHLDYKASGEALVKIIRYNLR